MLLTEDQRLKIVTRAFWLFDVHFGGPNENTVVFFGDGVDDFDQLISRLEINRQYNRARGQFIYCDVGDSYSSWRPADLEDILDMRDKFISIYGNIRKPNVYTEEPQKAIQR